MTVLIKNATIIDPHSSFNGKSSDIFIEDGFIRKIGNTLSEKADEVISLAGLHVSPGWIDVFANFADPGYEFKETLETGAAAAASGGFTDVFLIPNTNPCVHNKSGVEYIITKSKSLPVNLHPIGAVTRNTEGKELAEMYDMKASGAIAFGDGINCIQSAGLLVKALQYVKAFDGIVIQLPDDKSINPLGLMNEGIVSTQLGLPGKPSIAEELIIARDIKLAKYAESKIHFTGITTGKSVEYISRGKKSGTQVSCSVTPYHLYFSDEDLRDYDTNLKVNLPLRTKKDQDLLKTAITNGEIDCIATHHLPHEYDSKVIEFEYAKFGMTGLETAYAVLNTALDKVSQEELIKLLSINPRNLFGLEACSIKEGGAASMTLFQPSLKWTVDAKKLHSKSSNTAFDGKELTGKVAGIINGSRISLNN